MQAVLFYLTTYGFAMVGAFAVVTLVRDSGGEATTFARWQGLGRRSPLVAGLFAFFLLSMAGIPLTAGFVGQVGGLHGRAVGRRLAGRGRRDPVQHRRGVLLRPGDRADVLRRRRARRGRGRQRHPAVGADLRDHRRGRRARPSSWASCPARFSLSRPMRENSSGDVRVCRSRTPRRRTSARRVGCASGWRWSRRRWPGTSAAAPAFVTETASHLMAAGGKRFRPLLVLLAAETGDRPGLRRGHHRGLRRRAHPPRLALPRRRDGRGGPAPRRRRRAHSIWGNHVAILTGDFLFSKSSELTAELGAGRGPDPGADLHPPGRGPDPRDRRRRAEGEDPLEHYLEVVAGKTGSLIATSARYGARFGGATREVEEALTAYGEIVGSAFQLSDDILDIASDSGESGKTPGTDLREGVPTLPVLMAQAPQPTPPTPGCSSCSTATSPTTTCHAEALDLLRKHPALDEARAYVVARAAEAKQHLAAATRRPGPRRPRGLRRRRRHPLHLRRSREHWRRGSTMRRLARWSWRRSQCCRDLVGASPSGAATATPSGPWPTSSRRWWRWCTRTSSAGPGSPTNPSDVDLVLGDPSVALRRTVGGRRGHQGGSDGRGPERGPATATTSTSPATRSRRAATTSSGPGHRRGRCADDVRPRGAPRPARTTGWRCSTGSSTRSTTTPTSTRATGR